MKVECPLGDIVDRVTILLIKAEKIADATAVAHVKRELQTIQNAWAAEGHPPMKDLADWAALREVNGALWVIEDDLRDMERDGEFGDRFVQTARAVYFTNDKRAALKKSINEALGSRLVEQKSYKDYSNQ